jgi:uncharacterized membrane protein (DUF2068 family)
VASRKWGEYLAVVATSVLHPEIGELAEKPSPLEALTLAANAAIVAHLVVRLRRRED